MGWVSDADRQGAAVSDQKDQRLVSGRRGEDCLQSSRALDASLLVAELNVHRKPPEIEKRRICRVGCRFLSAPPGGTPCRFCREADATQLAEPNRPAAPLQVPALPRETRCLDCDLNRNSQRLQRA